MPNKPKIAYDPARPQSRAKVAMLSGPAFVKVSREFYAQLAVAAQLSRESAPRAFGVLSKAQITR